MPGGADLGMRAGLKGGARRLGNSILNQCGDEGGFEPRRSTPTRFKLGRFGPGFHLVAGAVRPRADTPGGLGDRIGGVDPTCVSHPEPPA